MCAESNRYEHTVKEIELPGRLDEGHQCVAGAMNQRASNHYPSRAEKIVQFPHSYADNSGRKEECGERARNYRAGPTEGFLEFKKQYPEHKQQSHINSLDQKACADD